MLLLLLTVLAGAATETAEKDTPPPAAATVGSGLFTPTLAKLEVGMEKVGTVAAGAEVAPKPPKLVAGRLETGLAGATPKPSAVLEGAANEGVALLAMCSKPANKEGGFSLAGAGVEVTVLGEKTKERSDRAGVVACTTATGGGAVAAAAWPAAAGFSSAAVSVSSGQNFPEVSAKGGGGEQTDGAPGCRLRKLKASRVPSVPRTCTMGMLGSCFSFMVK